MKTDKKNKKQRVWMIVVLLALFIVLVVFCHSCMREKEVSQYEKNVNEITEIDYSVRQEALNAVVEEGKMNVNYSSKAVFKGVVSEKFNIKNIKNNHHPIVFEILDGDGNCIYVSKKIEPGYEMNSIELQKELPKGTHECKIKVGYAEEGNVSSVFPIMIEVK